MKPDEPVENKTAEYTVTFSFNRNDNDFPVDYPTNPHFSPLVGWVHKKENTFFDFFQEKRYTSEIFANPNLRTVTPTTKNRLTSMFFTSMLKEITASKARILAR